MNTNTDPTNPKVVERRNAATNAFILKMHRMYHEVRNLPVCDKMACEHPWYPR